MTNPTLRQLEYAVALADHGHFGRAAEAAYVSQPALSGQVRELEERLGVTLFERDRRASRPTDAGTDVVGRAREILRLVDELVASASSRSGELTGTVRLGVIPTIAPYLLPALTAATRAAWPQVTLELEELQTGELVASVTDGSLDLALLATPYNTGKLVVHPMGEEEFVLAIPEGHDLVGTGAVPLEVLSDLPVLLLEEGHCLRDHALAACRLAGAVDHTEVRSASLATLSQMVAAGVGVTLLPTSSLPVETRDGSGLTTRRFRSPAPTRGIALAWRATDPRKPHFAELAERVGPLV